MKSILGIIASILILSLTSCNKEEAIQIRTSKVEKRTIIQTVSAIGRIEPETEVSIKPEVSGELIELNIQEGDTALKGMVLARIQPDIIETQLEQSKASAKAAETDIEFNKANMNQTEAQYKRVKELYDKEFSSLQELEQAKAAYDQSISRYQSSLANYERAVASLKQIQRQSDRTTIISPITGIVTTLNIEQGEKVQGVGSFAGTDMLKVADLSILNAKVEVDENDIVLLTKGDSVRIEIDAFPKKKFTGYVLEIGHSANLSGMNTQEQVTNFDVKIRLVDNDARIRPGMSCNVEIETEIKEDVLAVPLQAVTVRTGGFGGAKTGGKPAGSSGGNRGGMVDKRNEGKSKEPKPVVFVLDSNKAKLNNVEVGISDKGFIEVTKGLEEGQEIISGSYRAVSKDLFDGAAVTKEENNNKKKWKK